MGKKSNKQQKINENEYIKIEANEKWLCNIVDEKFYDKSRNDLSNLNRIHHKVFKSECTNISTTPKVKFRWNIS